MKTFYDLMQDEIATEVRSYMIEKLCSMAPTCAGKQVFTYNDGGSSNNHKCSNCGLIMYLSEVWPKLVYKKVKYGD